MASEKGGQSHWGLPYSQQCGPGGRGIVWVGLLPHQGDLQVLLDFLVDHTVEEKDGKPLERGRSAGGGVRGLVQCPPDGSVPHLWPGWATPAWRGFPWCPGAALVAP